MATKKRTPPPAHSTVSGGDKSIVVGGDVSNSMVVSGDVTVHQNFFQRIFITLFKPETETLDQRNRRILLNHVENFWVKGVLEKSLHGAAMLELGIKEDPAAVTYPWAIKKEETGETLPAGTAMLEIYEQIGMGRSLLILGAPGSGKTTMLLELARQLIERARQNADEPIPMVFNLASWTEKLSLADWLAQELNNIYYVPRKTAPDWVKGNKLLLLLDGLDEVRQESRAKCVEAINQFRKEHGLTSLVVCSRSQDYEELGAKLAFEGAIEVQPLTQKQVNEFFNRFGKEMAGLKSALKKDSALREMAETPLFLSIMVMAYRDKQDVDILVSQNAKVQREYLFDTYIEYMFERSKRSRDTRFKEYDVLHWLTWLAQKMIVHNAIPYLLENVLPTWLDQNKRWSYGLINGFFGVLVVGLTGGLIIALGKGFPIDVICGLLGALIFWLIGVLILGQRNIRFADALIWDWKQAGKGLLWGMIFAMIVGLIYFLFVGMFTGLYAKNSPAGLREWLIGWLSISGAGCAPIFMPIGFLVKGLSAKSIGQTTYPGQRVSLSIRNSFIVALALFLITGLIVELYVWLTFARFFTPGNWIEGLGSWLFYGLSIGLIVGLNVGLRLGGSAVAKHYILRFILAFNDLLPWHIIPFLDYCADLIFLRRVGGGYIFVHRLLMEHFAAMYEEEENDQRMRSG